MKRIGLLAVIVCGLASCGTNSHGTATATPQSNTTTTVQVAPLVQIPGRDVWIPQPPGEFGAPGPDTRPSDKLRSGLTFTVPGPIGTIRGSLSVSVMSDPATVALATSNDPAEQAKIGRDPSGPDHVTVAGRPSLFWPESNRIPSPVNGVPDRVYDMLVIPVGHDYIVEALSDTVKGDALRSYAESFVIGT